MLLNNLVHVFLKLKKKSKQFQLYLNYDDKLKEATRLITQTLEWIIRNEIGLKYFMPTVQKVQIKNLCRPSHQFNKRVIK